MSKTRWYVITGAPSSGKTTLLKELERLGYRVVYELARDLIETEMKQGCTLEEIRVHKKSFENRVLDAKISVEAHLPKDEVIIFDRAVPDSIAYFELADLDTKEVIAKSPRRRYRKVFLLDPLPYERDNVRIEDRETAERLDRSLETSYRMLGYEVTRIGVMPVELRLKLIIEHIEQGGVLMEKKVNQAVVKVAQCDITEMDTDAIVNAANAQLILGGGVAGAIKAKGGPKIQEECNAIGGTFVGGAVITTGGNLKARYVIHAVGPRMGEGDEDKKLKNATLNSLRVADENNLSSVTFPGISTGIFGFPKDRCADIMLRSVIDYLKEGKTGLKKVVFCLHGKSSYDVFAEALKHL